MEAFKIAIESGFLGIEASGTVMSLCMEAYVMGNDPSCIGRRVVLPPGSTPDWENFCDLTSRLGLTPSCDDTSGPIDEVDVSALSNAVDIEDLYDTVLLWGTKKGARAIYLLKINNQQLQLLDPPISKVYTRIECAAARLGDERKHED